MADTRRRDKEATRSEILEAASELFAKRGFANTSVAEIAKAAGVTKSLIHHHFGSKRQLWHEVGQQQFSGYRDMQALLMREQPERQVFGESFDIYFDFLASNPRLRRMWSWIALEEQPGPLPMGEELLSRGVEKVRRSQELGLLRDDVEPEVMLLCFLALVESWYHNQQVCLGLMGGEELDARQRYREQVKRVLLDGLAPQRGGGESR